MTREEAEVLALQVQASTGHEVTVEDDGTDGGEFDVIMTIARPRSEALRMTYVLGDEDDWQRRRDEITNA